MAYTKIVMYEKQTTYVMKLLSYKIFEAIR